MSLKKKINKSLKNKWRVRFETSHPDKDAYDGVVIYDTSDFVALHEEENFEFDGVVIISKAFIQKIRDNKYDKCCNEIIRQNGELEKIASPDWIEDCGSIKQIINSLKDKDIWAGIEIVFERKKKIKSSFYLGPITHIGEKFFRLKCYDADGKWEKEYELLYDEIFRIEFDSNYCNHFNKYMKLKQENGKIRNN